MSQLEVWRTQLGQGAAAWASAGRHAVEPGRWVALSGVPSTHVNAVLCWTNELEALSVTLGDVANVRAKAVVMLAGPALASAQVLVDVGWGCIGASPLMYLPASRVEPARDPAVRRLGADDFPAAREVIDEAYYTPGAAVGPVAVPGDLLSDTSRALWGIEHDGQLVSVLLRTSTDDTAQIWFMATRRSSRRAGHARRLLATVLTDEVDSGAQQFVLYASPVAEPLYRSIGFEVQEQWQMWSRPRWVLPRGLGAR